MRNPVVDRLVWTRRWPIHWLGGRAPALAGQIRPPTRDTIRQS